MSLLYMIIAETYQGVILSKNNWKLTFIGTWIQDKSEGQADGEQAVKEGVRQRTATIKIEMHELEALKYVVSATRIEGSTLAFHKIYKDLH